MSALTPVRMDEAVDTGCERKLWTVDEYHSFAGLGLLNTEDRIELIRGELIHKMTQGSAHAISMRRISRALQRAMGERYEVQSQLPITLAPHSEPEPDFAVLRTLEGDYEGRHPGPADVLLVVEVSDTTIVTDSTSKAALYAEFDIPEYWNLNLRDRMLAVCREPVPMPSSQYGFGYRSITLVRETETVSPLFEAGLGILVGEMLPRSKPIEG